MKADGEQNDFFWEQFVRNPHVNCRCSFVGCSVVESCWWCGQPIDDNKDIHERCKIIKGLASDALNKVT